MECSVRAHPFINTRTYGYVYSRRYTHVNVLEFVCARVKQENTPVAELAGSLASVPWQCGD